jgi:large subunit ribosomal protein L4
MEVNLYNLSNEKVGNIDLDGDIFDVEFMHDIVHRVVEWQRAKARRGTRSAKTISEVNGTTKKPHRQKGTGNARQGSLRAVHMKGGAVAHGPVVRDHSFSLPKKVRKLGLSSVLSEKLREGSLIVVDNLDIGSYKTSVVKNAISGFNFKDYFVIDDDDISQNFRLASRNLYNVSHVPQQGANVFDIVKHECVIISKPAIYKLQERLKNV